MLPAGYVRLGPSHKLSAGILLGLPRGYTQVRSSTSREGGARPKEACADVGTGQSIVFGKRVWKIRQLTRTELHTPAQKNWGSRLLSSFSARVRLKLRTSAADAAAVGQFKYLFSLGKNIMNLFRLAFVRSLDHFGHMS